MSSSTMWLSVALSWHCPSRLYCILSFSSLGLFLLFPPIQLFRFSSFLKFFFSLSGYTVLCPFQLLLASFLLLSLSRNGASFFFSSCPLFQLTSLSWWFSHFSSTFLFTLALGIPSLIISCSSHLPLKIVKFCQNCEILLKLWNSIKIVKFSPNCEIFSKLWNSLQIVKFCQNGEILSQLWNSVKIVKFCRNCEILSKL